VTQYATGRCLGARVVAIAGYANGEPRCVMKSDLCHHKSYGSLTNMDRSTVRGAAPSISLVYRTSSKGPDRKIQPKGWANVDGEREFRSLARQMIDHRSPLPAGDSK
jgi:hypothetical protein